MQPLDPNRTFPARNAQNDTIQSIRATFNYNDGLIGTGQQFGTIPQNSEIVGVAVDTITAFNAATTNVFIVGTTLGGSELVAAADVNEAAVGYTEVSRGLGRTLTLNGDVGVYAKYSQTGTAATAGQATVVISFRPPVTPS